MKGNKIIEISADDIIIGSILTDEDTVAVLKRTSDGDLYYEAKKDAVLPYSLGFRGENSKSQNNKS